ncbi:hypothetical protein M0805_001938 [Coniferiporia weirii]|nr:hypothetical protein M0805_001938 [Coniferiporia weirii]
MHAGIHSALNFGAFAHRFGVLPAPLSHMLYIRLASTATTGTGDTAERNGESSSSTDVYPFPKHAHPTPYEIFHLKPGAPAAAVKSRYYELVRMHHPDAPHARNIPAHVSHARFQAIKAAHDVLTGKMLRRDFPSLHSPSGSSYPPPSWGNKSYAHGKHRNGYRSHNVHAEWAQAANEAEESADDRWKDRTIMAIGLGIIGLTVFPFIVSSSASSMGHASAAQNLAQARREAREFGALRRSEIRKRVREQELGQENEDRNACEGYSDNRRMD